MKVSELLDNFETQLYTCIW